MVWLKVLLRLRNRMMAFLHRHGLKIHVAAILLTFVCGYYGLYLYDQTRFPPVPHWNPLDYAFYAFRLFFSSNVQFEYGINPLLQLARWLAPVLAGLTFILAFFHLFKKEAGKLLLPWINDHVIVCGLGSQGATLVRAWLRDGKTVVAIERDPANINIKQARHLGALVIEGDVRDPQVLAQAGVARARMLFSVCGDDDVAAEVFVLVARLAQAPLAAGRLTCFLHIVDTRLYPLLRYQFVDRQPSGRLEFFNLFANGVEILLQEFCPFGAGATPPPRILIVGLGPLGRSLVVHLARAWYATASGPAALLAVHVVDPEAERILQELHQEFPDLARSCRFSVTDLAVDSADFRSGRFLGDPADPAAPEYIYVCAADDSLSLKAALCLLGRLPPAVPIVVCAFENAGLFNLLQFRGDHRLRVFPLIERTCTTAVAEMGLMAKYARALHEAYCRERRAEGQTPEQNKSLVSWDALPESLKDSNRAQAMGVLDELALIGCTLVPLTDWSRPLFQFEPAEIERLAKVEHDRWVLDLHRRGWTLGKVKDAARKLSPWLIPYEELPPDIQEYDRKVIRAIPANAKQAGFEVIRLEIQ